jgi:hypothetical protein
MPLVRCFIASITLLRTSQQEKKYVVAGLNSVSQ